jgi:hypothetical protein
VNAFFAAGAKAFADKKIDWINDTIKVALFDASFVPVYDSATPPNITNASFLSDVSAAQVSPAVTLASKSDAAGLLVAADGTFSSVTGNTCVRLILWQDTGVAGTSILILAYDTGAGFPIVPNGGPIAFYWDPQQFRIAQI